MELVIYSTLSLPGLNQTVFSILYKHTSITIWEINTKNKALQKYKKKKNHTHTRKLSKLQKLNYKKLKFFVIELKKINWQDTW